MENNKTIKLKSCVLNEGTSPVESLIKDISPDIFALFDNGTLKNMFLLYFYDKIKLLTYDMDEIQINGMLSELLQPENLLEARIFNLEEEIHLWRHTGGFSWRYRRDQNEINDENSKKFDWKDQNIYQEFHFIQGNDIKSGSGNNGNKNYLVNNRGAHIEINLPELIKNPVQNLPIQYQIYNYFTYNELGLIHFCDARLCNILNKEGEILQ